ncbi:GTP cyclohydrolase II [uncultured Winogradskyella sp.]|uniref:GTP cyclohydrolase II n=1 Tax=uncultured Winogradskyella sp. TaxID=395353 RepID=UPI0026120853|nr:GTP cyclohydrolase II [uncultured Winogradskyella sp.]
MKDKILKLQSKVNMETIYGNFNIATFTDSTEDLMPHIALFTDQHNWSENLPVRIHSECMTGDLFGSKRCECGEQLQHSLKFIQEHSGILIYLRQEGRGIGIINKLKAYCLQDEGYNTAEANKMLGFEEDQRQYNDAIKILDYFNVKNIRLLTNNPDKLDFFNDKKINVVERIPIESHPNETNYSYLKTKKDHFGHFLTKL